MEYRVQSTGYRVQGTGYRVGEWSFFRFFVFLLESNGPGMISPTHRVYDKYAARTAQLASYQ